MKEYDLYGVGNGILDLLCEITEEGFAKLKIDKSSFALVSSKELALIMKEIEPFIRSRNVASGGSVANSVAICATLGAKTAFTCGIGDDQNGLRYIEDFQKLSTLVLAKKITNGESGVCLAMITPDAHRTMRTFLGVAGDIAPSDVDQEVLANSKVVFLEGYLLANPKSGFATIEMTAKQAKKSSTIVALSLSDPAIVTAHKEELLKIFPLIDMIICNHLEAAELSHDLNPIESVRKLKELVPQVIVTASEQGAYYSLDGEISHQPAYPCKLVDLTGAGDAFAGATLRALCAGAPIDMAVKSGAFVAAQVISQIGARLPLEFQQRWKSSFGGVRR
ncbi:MAG TPA: adenosine kinase [Oligoflexia bacterium]|nr:adenosine kinase [Oligoflexia bacterium]HMP27643.1 adenosine kinase [Oligoflexia bacterium]